MVGLCVRETEVLHRGRFRERERVNKRRFGKWEALLGTVQRGKKERKT